jgi:kinesin family protein 18/19
MPVTEGSKVAVDSDGNDNVLVPPPADTSSSRGAHTGDHKNAMWRGQSNILVAVRVRPDAGKKCATVMDGKLVVVKDPRSTGPGSRNVLRAKRSRDKRFAFDYAFGPKSTQQQVYERTTKFLIDGVLDGYNATVFAYGATGAGKTYTMLGSDTEPGIMVLTLRDMFSQVRRAEEDTKRGVKYKVTISYLEVYNELIRDLLTPSSEFLDLREDPIKGPTVAGISEVSTSSTDEVMRLLQKGNKRRTQEPTAANAESSRSHAVLQVCVEKQDSAPGVKNTKVKIGKLSMIDLAGSERLKHKKSWPAPHRGRQH